MISKYPVRYFNYATVVNVVDGDTVDVIVDLGFSVKVKHRFRLARIDTPERGQIGWAEATAYLKGLVLDKSVQIESTKLDKFGRYLCEIYVGDNDDETNANDAMLAAGHARLYGTAAVPA